jgi:hypothetical protein
MPDGFPAEFAQLKPQQMGMLRLQFLMKQYIGHGKSERHAKAVRQQFPFFEIDQDIGITD